MKVSGPGARTWMELGHQSPPGGVDLRFPPRSRPNKLRQLGDVLVTMLYRELNYLTHV
jgi:hypothetical protein